MARTMREIFCLRQGPRSRHTVVQNKNAHICSEILRGNRGKNYSVPLVDKFPRFTHAGTDTVLPSVSLPSVRLSGCLVGLFAEWLADWLTGWLVGWLAGWLAG